MSHLSLNAKLWLAFAVMWTGLLLLGGSTAWEARSAMLDERKAALEDVVDAAVGVVGDLAAQADAGRLGVDEAKRQALARLQAMRYGKDGFLMVTDARPVVLMHPTLADLRNKDMSHFRGPNGTLVFVDMVRTARASGQGYVEYLGRIRRGDAYVNATKLTFVRRFAPWDWYVESGVYLDDVDAAFRAQLLRHLLLVLATGAAVTAAMGLITRNVRRSIGGEPAYAVDIANRIAANDLSGEVNTAAGDDASLLYTIRRMQSGLARRIASIRGATGSMVASIQEIAASNLDLSRRTEEQAASLEQTAASMEQLTGAVRQTADHAQQASALAGSASSVAQRGGAAVAHIVATMRSISGSSARVADIIGVIEGIAFQTNILALNAAVEAARAGEHGRGFAVVAAEVRTLAQRSAAASKEIRDLIGASAGHVDEGERLVAHASDALGEVVDAVRRVESIIGEIAGASDEQSTGIAQINRAVGQLDRITQQNAALVEQVAAAAQSMVETAHALGDTVGVFEIGDAHREGLGTAPRLLAAHG